MLPAGRGARALVLGGAAAEGSGAGAALGAVVGAADAAGAGGGETTGGVAGALAAGAQGLGSGAAGDAERDAQPNAVAATDTAAPRTNQKNLMPQT